MTGTKLVVILILTQIPFKVVISGGDSFASLNFVFNNMQNDIFVNNSKIKQPELVETTLDNVSVNFTAEVKQSTRTIQRVKFVQTTQETTANIPDDKSLKDCLYDEDSGDLISTSGNCDHSCVDGKVIEIFFIGREMFCCCKHSNADTTLINLSTIESSFETTEMSKTQTFKEDTTMTLKLTEMSVLPSITTEISIILPENQPIQDCTYNKQSGELTNTNGSCYDSCQDDKVLNIFFINNKLLCCCKTGKNKSEIILPEDMPLKDCIFDPISHEVTNIGGNCYESCADGKFIAMFQQSKNSVLCCCK